MTSTIHQIGGDKGPPAITSVISQLKDWRGRNRRHHQLHSVPTQEHTRITIRISEAATAHGLSVTGSRDTCTNVAAEEQVISRIAPTLLVRGQPCRRQARPAQEQNQVQGKQITLFLLCD